MANVHELLTPPVIALNDAARRGEFVKFRGLLEAERERMLRRARQHHLPEADSRECVETAVALAFRRFLYRDRGCALARWLNILLDEAVQSLPEHVDAEGVA